MSRIYEVVFDNVTVSAVQDLAQINGASGKMVRILRRWVNSTDVPVATQQQLGLRERFLPATVTNGNGTLTTPSKTDPGIAAASFTAYVNSTTKAATSGTAVLLGAYGAHIFNGFDEEPDVFFPVGPGQAYVFELEVTPTAGPIHLSGGVTVEELGG